MASRSTGLPQGDATAAAMQRERAHGGPADTAARALVAAVSAGDFAGVAGLLAPDARLRLLTPRRTDELTGPPGITARFSAWFGGRASLEVQEVTIASVGDRGSARYRLLVSGEDGPELIEQHVFLDVAPDGRIVRLDLLCSGFLPLARPERPAQLVAHRFDAGTMGCADGLADEVRRRIAAIPVGDVLEVVARDPAAKEDLPPLARMLGHTVQSTAAVGDGRLVLRIERNR